jgi:hypothetical protein
MAVWLPILILILVLATIRKSGHERKGDLGFVVVILVIALLVLGTRF